MHIRHLYRQVNNEMEFCFNIESSAPLSDEEIGKLRHLLADGFIAETVLLITRYPAIDGGLNIINVI